MARKILLMLVVGLATASTSLLALGLGEIKLKSGLNQPLDAEITLLSVRGESNEQLRGKLGSISDFDRSGMERSFFLSKIRFNTITKNNGQKVLHLTTHEAVKEPFLNFLVDLEWPNGRLLREYTLLLDPPVFDDAPKTTVAPAVRQSKPKPTQTKPRRVEPAPRWEGEVYGPTSSNDTLWGIASKVRPSRSVTMQQAMITLYEANPSAFMRGNINNLKKGAELRIPDAEQFQQISQREALNMIAVHSDNWKSGRTTSPRPVMDASPADVTSDRTASGATNSGRLSLSTDDSDTGSATGSTAGVLNEEASEVLKQQNESLQEQSKTDADRIQQLERLLELKDEQLANIQNRDSNETETTQVQEASSQVATEPTQDSTSSVDTATSNDEKPEIMDVTPSKSVNQPAPKSIVDEIMAGTYNLYLGIAAVLILLLLVISSRKKKDGIEYNDVVANKATNVERVAPVEDDVTDLPEIADDVLAGTDSADFEEVNVASADTSDPIGEADIYLAYGKFEQAETLLLSALGTNPERTELNSKLLECYAEMPDKNKFEALVDNISDAIDADSELGNYVEELYQTTWPDGQLYASEDTAALEQEPAAEEFIDTVEDIQAEEAVDIVEDEFELDDSIFDDSSISEDLPADLEDLPSTEDVFGDEAESSEDIATDSEYELALDMGDSSYDDENESEFSEELVEDEDSDENDEVDDADDVETQLDLARAYVEMGDTEGTREIIKEIMESGTNEQCEEAQQILDSIED